MSLRSCGLRAVWQLNTCKRARFAQTRPHTPSPSPLHPEFATTPKFRDPPRFIVFGVPHPERAALFPISFASLSHRARVIDGGAKSCWGTSMFGRYQLAAVLFLGIFGAAMCANSALSEPALPEVSEPAVQLAQVLGGCNNCRRQCSERRTICSQLAHSTKAHMKCRNRYNYCISRCPCR